jgi:hypothetical protein
MTRHKELLKKLKSDSSGNLHYFPALLDNLTGPPSSVAGQLLGKSVPNKWIIVK